MGIIADNRATAMAALADPVRRRIYDLVAGAPDLIGRDEIAARADLPRSTAAFHLDRLVEAGVLTTEYKRLSGRSGPGAGRPAKLYRAVSTELLGSVPERHYELAGEVLAGAAVRADRDGIPMRDAVTVQARDVGTAVADEHPNLEAALDACGYAPITDENGTVTLCNCPFHALADRHTDLICGANLALVSGIVEATGDTRTARLVPRAGHCCVEVSAAAAPSGASVKTPA
ncbi:helix-turn-helix transcriptional regulator [Microbacterium sp.]|uniref:helix-turn-helix transcriptional regulator n=1 Tax=Microbacterium sp. TaxID=51671 RepID=UPI003A8CA720